jgi:hypothetical protein
VIWVLLGLLLFGGAAASLSQPQGRVVVMQENIDSIVLDADRRASARAITDRMGEEGESTRSVVHAFASRLRELDAAAEFRDEDYRAALDRMLDQVDASESRLVDLRMQLRAGMTSAEWTALMSKVRGG